MTRIGVSHVARQLEVLQKDRRFAASATFLLQSSTKEGARWALPDHGTPVESLLHTYVARHAEIVRRGRPALDLSEFVSALETYAERTVIMAGFALDDAVGLVLLADDDHARGIACFALP